MTRPVCSTPLAVAAALVALAAVPRVATAQTAPPATAPERDQQARAEFGAGREAFERGEYEDAARRFEHALQLSARPQLWYNIGASYDRLHRWTAARDAFRHYLAEVPDAPQRDEVRARLTIIEQEIAREDEMARERAAQTTAPPPPPRVEVRTVAEPSRPFRTAGVVAGGLAVIAGGISLTIGLLTNSYYSELVSDCGATGCPQSAINDVATRATLVNVFIGVAGVLAALSVTSFVIDLTGSHDAPSPHARAFFAPGLLTAPTGGIAGGALVFAGTL